MVLRAGKLQVADLVSSLREVAHSDAHLAHHLWVLVFPIVWATLSEKKEQQVRILMLLGSTLSCNLHQQHAIAQTAGTAQAPRPDTADPLPTGMCFGCWLFP